MAGCRSADELLLRMLHLSADRGVTLEGSRDLRYQHGAAMRALNVAGFREVFEIAANGGLRTADGIRQVLNRSRTVFAQVIQYQDPPFGGDYFYSFSSVPFHWGIRS